MIFKYSIKIAVNVTSFASGTGSLLRLPPPTDLKLLEKSDKIMHVAWSPPEIFDPAYKDLITHYLVVKSNFKFLHLSSFSGKIS